MRFVFTISDDKLTGDHIGFQERSPFIPSTSEFMNSDIASSLTRITLIILFGSILSFILSFLVAWLWNSVMPELFGFKTIEWYQALVLAILARLILGTGYNFSK
jgi:hypothetical protein